LSSKIYKVLLVPIAGILTEAFSDAAAVVVAVTGLFGGASRYAAVLAGWEKDKSSERPRTGSSSVFVSLFFAY
jgi:hypothetical protein